MPLVVTAVFSAPSRASESFQKQGGEVFNAAGLGSHGQQSVDVGAKADINVRRAAFYAKYTSMALGEKSHATANDTQPQAAQAQSFEVRSMAQPDAKMNSSLPDQLRESGKREHHEPWHLFQELMRKDREASIHKSDALLQTDAGQGDQKRHAHSKYVALLDKMENLIHASKTLDSYADDGGSVLGPSESATTPAPADNSSDNTLMYAGAGIAIVIAGYTAWSVGQRKAEEARMAAEQQNAMMGMQNPNDPYAANMNDPAMAGLQPMGGVPMMGAPPPPQPM